MKILVFLFLIPLVVGDYFKETQNFKFSRTSPDEGEKKGFYEAQSGNMGGNFEVSRNMDTLAQRQLHDLKYQVGNQLGIDPHAIGTGATETGGPTSVFGSASTSGTIKGSLSDHSTQQKERDYYNAGNSYNSNQRGTARGVAVERSRMAASHNSGMSTHSLNTDFDDSQRVLDASAVNNGYNYGNAQQSADSGYHSSANTGTRRVVGTRYQSATTGAESDGTSNVRYEAGSYIPKTSRTDSLSTGSQYYGGSSNAYNTFGSQTHDTDSLRSGSGVTRVYVPVGGITPVAQIQAQNTGSQSSFSKTATSAREYESSGIRTSGSTIAEPSSTYPERSVLIQPVYVRTGELNNGQQFTSENSQTLDENSNSRTIHVQPGTRVHIKARPSQSVRVVLPAQSTQQIGYTGSHSVDQNSDSSSRIYETYPERNVNVGYSQINQNYDNRESIAASPKYAKKIQVASTVSGRERDMVNQNSESRHVGRTYGSQQDIRTTGYRSEASDITSGRTHNIEDNTNAGLIGNQYSTQPKSYQSSYSYHKAWERHGTPYQILPNGETVPITSDSQLSAGFDQSKGDMATSATADQSRYVAGQQSASSLSSRSQFGSTHGSSYSANQDDTMKSKMSEMQERLQNQMKQMCTDCGGTKTKGYSAQYSYSAQRGYGGNDETSH